MATLATGINHSRLYLGAMIDYFQLWKEVRDKVSLLADHIPNIEDNWDKFAALAPIIGKETITAMGSNSKSDAAPDDMMGGPSVNISPAKVFVLYDKAIELGFEFGTVKLYKPTVSQDDAEYGEQIVEATAMWSLIGDLYFQIKDSFYKIQGLRKAFGTLSGLGDTGTMERSPGQLALNFPISTPFLSKNDHPVFNRMRIFDKLGDEYHYWMSRSNIDMIQNDPPNYTVSAELIKTSDSTASPYIFAAPNDTDVIVGVDFYKADKYSFADPQDDPEICKEYPQSNQAWEEAYICDPNQIKLIVSDDTDLRNHLLIAIVLRGDN